ncbi:MAG: creatininase family protein [Rhodospirillaceae bacterium]|nr:creatininase family protein [Rhodospirillaceae bacterium]
MRKFAVTAAAFALLAGSQFAVVSSAHAAAAPKADQVEMELMTWPELKAAMAAGKTTAIIYTGGTEQRGPQNVIGGHQFMGKPLALDIARKLGNAIVFPVMPYTPTGMSKDLPGSINLSADVLQLVLEQLAEGAIVNGFKNVVLAGDSGGGQGPNGGVYAAAAKKVQEKHAAEGVKVIFADQSYAVNNEFLKQIVAEGYPMSTHGGIPDTSLMMLLDKDGTLVRKDLVATALGDPVPPPGQKPDPNAKRVNNGISGDGRRSSVELGKRLYDMKLNAAVTQIQAMLK